LNDPVTAYARGVLAGEIVAGPYVIWACERHMRDLKRDDIYLDLNEVSVLVDFFRMLKHYKGKWAGKPVELDPWQVFCLGSLYGWKRKADGFRRFREGFLEVPRKNGKSTKAGGVALYGLTMDNEPGPEVYTVATKRGQAKIVWNDAKVMGKACRSLAKRINFYVNNISMPSVNGKLEPLSRDSKGHDGLNPSLALMDELHAWEDRLMWDQVEDAMGARDQPLILSITTAGTYIEGICFEKHEHGINVLDPVQADYDDDTLFVYIATVSDPEALGDPLQWAMANPSLGGAKGLEYMQEQYRKAVQSPSRMNAFKVKQLNIWTNAPDSWLDMVQWKAAEDKSLKLEDFYGKKCFLGLDLAEVNDLSALIAIFPGDDDVWRAFSWFWCPEEDIAKRADGDRVPYQLWERMGYLKATPGAATDFDFIEAEILAIAEKFDVQGLLYDRWKSQSVVQNLDKEEICTCIPYGQGYKEASPALREIERRLLCGKFRFAPNPVLTWNAGNACVAMDPAENIKLIKKMDRKRIDGMAALANAAGGLVGEPPEDTESVYEERGVIELG